ncbi:hypothetical protein A2U01_0023702, partial [Trifolium medium]|nr:hypothetical protein [Trifolium medium]
LATHDDGGNCKIHVSGNHDEDLVRMNSCFNGEIFLMTWQSVSCVFALGTRFSLQANARSHQGTNTVRAIALGENEFAPG